MYTQPHPHFHLFISLSLHAPLCLSLSIAGLPVCVFVSLSLSRSVFLLDRSAHAWRTRAQLAALCLTLRRHWTLIDDHLHQGAFHNTTSWTAHFGPRQPLRVFSIYWNLISLSSTICVLGVGGGSRVILIPLPRNSLDSRTPWSRCFHLDHKNLLRYLRLRKAKMESFTFTFIISFSVPIPRIS